MPPQPLEKGFFLNINFEIQSALKLKNENHGQPRTSKFRKQKTTATS